MDKWGYSYLIELKALWEKEKLALRAISPFPTRILTHSHTMTPFDAPGKQAF